ncbi:hypothetical protein KHQ82_05510 [Mycoplasmatota bacterium]|nr:hypothetical protein KHQ82_05510 [Mycoplasmatota bacterium]
MENKKNRDNYENVKRNKRKVKNQIVDENFDVEIAEAAEVLSNYDGGRSIAEEKRINKESLNDNSYKH